MSAPLAVFQLPRAKAPDKYDQRVVEQNYQAIERDLEQKFDRRGDLILDPGAELVLTADNSSAQYGLGIDNSGYLRVLDYSDGTIGTFSVAWAQVDGAAQEITNLTAYVDAADATLQAGITTNASSITTNGAAIGTIETEITAARDGEASLNAKITSVETAFASADTAIAADVSTLTAEINNAREGEANLLANITDVRTAFAAGDTANATSITNLSAFVSNPSPNLQPRGNFEEAATDWVFSFGARVSNSNGVYWLAGGLSTGTYVLGYSPGFTISDSETYSFSYEQDPTLTGSAEIRADLECYDSEGGTLLGRVGLVGSTATDWTRVESEGITPSSGATWARVRWFINGGESNNAHRVRRVKVEQNATATAYSPEGSLEAIGASVDVSASAIADIEGNLSARYAIAVDGGGAGAFFSLEDGTAGPSNIILSASDIILDGDAINLGSDTEFETTDNTFITESGGNRLRYGGPFGSSNNLILWFGPTSVAQGSETTANGTFSLDTSGNINDPIAQSDSDSDASFTASTTSGTWETVCSVTVDVAGACVLTFEGNLNWNEVVSAGSTQGTLQYRLRRDSTVIKGPIISENLTATTAPSTWDRNFPFDSSYTDIPSSGTYTYTLQMQHVETATGTRSGKAITGENMELAAVSFSR